MTLKLQHGYITKNEAPTLKAFHLPTKLAVTLVAWDLLTLTRLQIFFFNELLKVLFVSSPTCPRSGMSCFLFRAACCRICASAPHWNHRLKFSFSFFFI